MQPPTTYCETTLVYARGMARESVPVRIYNGRVESDLDFHESGFVRLDHHSAVTDWSDEGHVAEVHRPEVAALAKALTGCDHAVAYMPLIRSPDAARTHPDYAPIQFVHSDFTEDYGRMVRDGNRAYRAFIEPLLTEAGLSHAELSNARDIALIQFWRNTGHEHPDFPLAFCDARTSPRSDLGTFVVPEYGGQRLEFETFYAQGAQGARRHKWYTFPRLNRDEVIAFRTYDSRLAAQGMPFWTLHSAFRDPTAGDEAPQRESVEMRVLCLFE
ncbi:MAG: hypothetical protein KDI19_04730 [Pseudomonadales bacterium]|nr:hypothetical protein [Pseudomonadales bacterium]